MSANDETTADALLPPVRPDLVLEAEGAGGFVVDPERGEIFELNETSRLIFEACRQGNVEARRLAEEIASRFEVAPERVAKDIQTSLQVFRAERLLKE